MEKDKLKLKQKRIMDSIASEQLVFDGMVSENKVLLREIGDLKKDKTMLKSSKKTLVRSLEKKNVELKLLSNDYDGIRVSLDKYKIDLVSVQEKIASLEDDHSNKNKKLIRDYSRKEREINKKIDLMNISLEKNIDKNDIILVDIETSKSTLSGLNDDVKDLEKNITSLDSISLKLSKDIEIKKSENANLDLENKNTKEDIKKARLKLSGINTSIEENNKLEKKAIKDREEAEEGLAKINKKNILLSQKSDALDNRERIIKAMYEKAGIPYN